MAAHIVVICIPRACALRAGASGFLLKDTAPEELLAAIRTLAAGDPLLAPGITRRLIREFAARPEPEERPSPKLLESLSVREREVLVEVPAAGPTPRSVSACTSRRPPPKHTSAAC